MNKELDNLKRISLSQFKNDIQRYNEETTDILFMGEMINIDFSVCHSSIIFDEETKLFGFINWGRTNPQFFIQESNIRKIFQSIHYFQIELKNGDLLHINFRENEWYDIDTDKKERFKNITNLN